MYEKMLSLIRRGLEKQVPATGLGIFRIFFGLVILQEVIFLYYFRHLIFDSIPFIDIASPAIHFFLILWGINSLFLTLGNHTRLAAVVNYFFWVIFTTFTPMWRDFDGGFDQFIIGSSFLLVFLPAERAISLDNLRLKLKFSKPGVRYIPPCTVSVLCYYLPLAISLGLLYFDSAIHKLFAEHWRHGLGAWLPSTMPYYISPIDMTWLLDNKLVQKLIGYLIIVFQFIFVFLCYFWAFRIPLLFFGFLFHSGIILSLNIYPFGLAMLVFYFLMVPFSWWRKLKEFIQLKQPALTIFYDQQCPLCNRTAIIVEHFDFFRAIEFKGLQTAARQYRALDAILDRELLEDLYALDQKGRLYSGLETYIQILLKMKYPAFLGVILKLPGFFHLGDRGYRHVADRRTRLVCDEKCPTAKEVYLPEDSPLEQLYTYYAGTAQQRPKRLTKGLVVILLLQLNSTIHYGILYRFNMESEETEIAQILGHISNGVLSLSHIFLGITPHALYLHDHLEGYNRILALTYKNKNKKEQWLPFVNQEGRLIAPNWGRVQSMWANIAVTPHIEQRRLHKFIQKITAFWGAKLGLNLSNTEFIIKMKEIDVPFYWKEDLRNKNLKQPWKNIGKATWEDGLMRMKIKNEEINSL